MPSTRNSRIQILTSEEIDELYRRPEFHQAEREEFLSLDIRTLEHIRKMEKLKSRLHFILLMGYFRSKPVSLKGCQARRSVYLPNLLCRLKTSIHGIA